MGYSFSKNYSAHTNEYIHDEDDEERVAFLSFFLERKKDRKKEKKSIFEVIYLCKRVED